MGFLTDWLTDWLKGLLIEGIMGNLTGLFDTVNTRVGEIAVQVGTTPAAWNAGVFSLIRQLSETVILPISGLVLTFVATYELIQLIIEKNNLHDLDYWIFFKWIFKTAAAILILSNTFNIVMAVFDVSQSVIASAAGIVQGSTDISSSMIDTLEASLETMSLGALLGLWLQSFLKQQLLAISFLRLWAFTVKEAFMAISKSAKIEAEIEKVKAKISEQQTRLKELEQKKVEAENSEIVDIVRGMSIPLAELPVVLQQIRAGATLGQNVPKSETEDKEDSE